MSKRDLGADGRQDRRGCDRDHAIEPIEARLGLLAERADRRRRDLVLGGHVEGGIRARQELERLGWVAVDEIHARPEDLGEVVAGGPQGRLANGQRSEISPRVLAADRPDEGEQPARDDDQREDRDRRPPLHLPLRRRGRDPPVRGPSMRKEILESGDQAIERPTRRDTGPDSRRLDGGDPVGHVVGKRNRGAIRRPGERLRRTNRNQRARLVGRRHLRRLQRDHCVAGGPVSGDEPVVEMLHRGLRVEGHHRILELVRAELGHDIRRDEHE